MKIKIIDLLNKIANEELKNNTRIKYDETIYVYRHDNVVIWDEKYKKADLFNEICTDTLNDEIEIIEEPKEELEEIELIDIHYVNDKCIFKVYGQSIEETIAIKVNELIDEVNKLKKERIRNNGKTRN